MKKVPEKSAFLPLLLSLPVLFLCCSCGKKSDFPQIRQLGDAVFGREYPIASGELSRSCYIPFFCSNFEQKLEVTPLSGKLWKCDIFISEIPGRGDPITLAENYFTEIFGVDPQKIPGLTVEFSNAYDRSPKGVKVSFIHRKSAELAEYEKTLPEVQQILKREKILQRLMIIASALEEHLLDTGKYPDFLLELKISSGNPKWNGPYLQEIPADPAGREFVYRCKEAGPTPQYELFSTDENGEKLISLPK